MRDVTERAELYRAVEASRGPTSGSPARAGSQVPLARADWRFLLPQARGPRFERLLLLGGTPELAERLVEIGVAQQVTCAAESETAAEAVVVLNGLPAALPAIARYVRPGGVLYLEVHRRALRRWAPGPHQVCRQLRSAGLRPLQTYAVWPGFSDDRTYLPLDVPQAFRWYVSTLHAARTASSTVLDAGARALLAVSGRPVTRLAPAFAVVAVAGSAPEAEHEVIGRRYFSAAKGSGDVRMVLLTHGGDRAVIMLFRGTDRRPVAVLKVPRLPAFNGRTGNEQQVLSSLAHSLDSQLRDSLPEPLGLFVYGDLNVAVESYRPGTPLWRLSRQWGRPLHKKVSDLHAAAGWLGDFHRQTEITRSPWGVDETARWVDAPLEAYQRAFGVTAGEESLFARARSYAPSLAGTPFPIVWLHRDFKPNHVLRSASRIAVIDWEGGRAGPALCDLLHFLVHWHAAVRGLSGFSGLSRLFFDSGPSDAVSRAVRDAIAAYMHALRVDDRLFPVLLLYTCVELVLRRAEQQRLEGETSAQLRDGNQNFELIDVLVRHGEELFCDGRFHAYAG